MLQYLESDHINQMIVLNVESMAYFWRHRFMDWISREKFSIKLTLSQDTRYYLDNAKKTLKIMNVVCLVMYHFL